MPDFGDRRIMACSPADLKRWLGELCGWDEGLVSTGAPAAIGAVGAATVDLGGHVLTLRWEVLEPRQIALLRVEQLELEFSYPPGAAALARAWIARFDGHTQRGGG